MFSEAQAADPLRLTGGLTADRLRSGGVVLYGSGSLGRHVLGRLRASGINPRAFADDTPSKDGTVVDGVPVLTPARAIETLDGDLVFIVTIFNAKLKFLEARARLESFLTSPVFSFVHLAHALPQALLPYGPFASPSVILAARDAIARSYDLLADEESRRQFAGHLRFRLQSDFAALPPNSHASYFPPDLLRGSLPSDIRFVDCGAYDGDTIRAFLGHQRGRFSTIDAFEPDAANFGRLVEFVRSLGPSMAHKITLHHMGVGAEGGARPFDGTGNMAAAFSAAGTTSARIMPIDDVIQPDARPLYVKYDIEGGERDALRGSQRLIQRAQPLLAMSIYHRPADLWQLPAQIKSLQPGYQIYVRTEGEDGTDVVCYALPEERIR